MIEYITVNAQYKIGHPSAYFKPSEIRKKFDEFHIILADGKEPSGVFDIIVGNVMYAGKHMITCTPI